MSEAITRTDLMNILNEVLPTTYPVNYVDYVVEQGTSGDWKYRKWNSGIAECWGRHTISVAVNTASAGYGGYRSGNVSIPSYPFTFAEAPAISATINENSNGAWINNITPTKYGAGFLLSCGGSQSAADRTFSIYAIGKWK